MTAMRQEDLKKNEPKSTTQKNPPITYYWTSLLILGHSYIVGNLTNSKIAETKA